MKKRATEKQLQRLSELREANNREGIDFDLRTRALTEAFELWSKIDPNDELLIYFKLNLETMETDDDQAELFISLHNAIGIYEERGALPDTPPPYKPIKIPSPFNPKP